MLQITIPETEMFDEKTEQFIISKETKLVLEHSLVSVSKWESRWCKPFLVKGKKSIPETLDYIKCMTITQNVDERVYKSITNDLMDQITAYIDAPMTATTFRNETQQAINREIITSEVIYYWMVALNIPFECEKWHLNRLLTLINVCNIKSQPKKKIGRRQLLEENRALNAARRKASGSSG